MNKLLLCIGLISLILRSGISFGQSITWEKSLGGTLSDGGNSILINSWGNIITLGYTYSNDFDVSGRIGLRDFWLCESDSNGVLLRQKCFGTSYEDNAVKIIQTFDGGYLLTGNTNYPNGTCHDLLDFRCIKIDSLWNIQWENCFGSSLDDELKDIIQTPDSGFVLVGNSFGNDGDVPFHYGSYSFSDIFIAKISKNSVIEWSKNLGGTSGDIAAGIAQTSTGEFILVGSTWSVDYDIPAIHTGSFCAFKLDSIGNIIWVRTYGGSGNGDKAIDMILNDDDSFIVMGQTESQDGDVVGFIGALDVWIFKSDSAGNLIWQKCLGSNGLESGIAVNKTLDKGYIVAAFSAGGDSIIQNYVFGPDCWIVKLDSTGIYEWSKIFGGSLTDEFGSIVQYSAHQYTFVATTRSNDFDVSFNHSTYEDKWLVKITDPILKVYEALGSISDVSLNYSSGKLSLSFISEKNIEEKIYIIDMLGRTQYYNKLRISQGINNFYLDVHHLKSCNILNIGEYRLKFVTD